MPQDPKVHSPALMVAQLSMLGDADLAGCGSLAELRLGHNELADLPAALSACSRLKIVELGSNRIVNLSSIEVRACHAWSCCETRRKRHCEQSSDPRQHLCDADGGIVCCRC